MTSAADISGDDSTPTLQCCMASGAAQRLVIVSYCRAFRSSRTCAGSVTTRTSSAAGHGQVNWPQAWWLTVGVRRAARAEPTAPTLIADWSMRMPVGQFRYSRPVVIRPTAAMTPTPPNHTGLATMASTTQAASPAAGTSSARIRNRPFSALCPSW